MKIEQSGQTLTVTQTAAGKSDVKVTYDIGGKEVVFTGLDPIL